MEKKIALSVEQMKHLQELGLDTSDASLWWVRIIRPGIGKKDTIQADWFLSLNHNVMKPALFREESMPAYILQDIIEIAADSRPSFI